MKLTIELVPATSWGHNVRSEVSKAAWDKIRKHCYKEADNVCEICGRVGKRHPVECHEIWDYDDSLGTQTLVGFVALCPMCHRVKHMGRTISVGLGDTAIRHFAMVNELSIPEALTEIDKAFNMWDQRNTRRWKVDISFVKKYMET